MPVVDLARALERTHEALLRYVRLRVREPSDVQDVFQDVVEKILKSKAPPSEERFLPWAFCVARCVVLDHYRARTRRRRLMSRIRMERMIADSARFETLPEGIDLVPMLRRLLARLSPQDRAVLNSVYFNRMPQFEYARQRGLSYSAAKSRFQRAKKRLSREMHRCCVFELDSRGRVLGYSCNPGYEKCCC